MKKKVEVCTCPHRLLWMSGNKVNFCMVCLRPIRETETNIEVTIDTDKER